MRSSIVLLASFPLAIGCSGEPAGQGATGAPSGSASSAPDASGAPSSSGGRGAERVPPGSDEIRPVYPIDKLPPEPIAERYCDAVHTTFADRRAACCGEKANAPARAECVRTLSAAVRSKAITVDDAQLSTCEQEVKTLLDGCGWVGLAAPPLPPACHKVFSGKLAADAVCRSSLECEDGLRCYGLGATQPGRCAKPRPKDGICSVGTDTLAPLTRQDRFESRHPECAGYCMQRRCQDPIAKGAACKASIECGPGSACVEGRCSDAPLPQEGASCAGDECEPGLRCSSGTCKKPGLEGDACKADGDCYGRCENGRCKQRCRLDLKELQTK
ncbi:MAG: hypothetical protein HOW73_21725 [Polyangiaceae bacterium]|nr:hypothetical protein [Polyangiaceae bacterium]